MMWSRDGILDVLWRRKWVVVRFNGSASMTDCLTLVVALLIEVVRFSC